jgi:RNA polymerase sigma-70 factor, ECF subfamily
MVFAKCRRMLKGDAEALDVAQEVFVRLWKHRELIQDQSALLAWLYRTSTRLVIDRARQRSLGRDSLLDLDSLLMGGGGDSEARFVSREQLRRVLGGCEDAELEAAILNRVDRLTQPEVAELMGVGERTVRRLLSRFDERVSELKEDAR